MSQPPYGTPPQGQSPGYGQPVPPPYLGAPGHQGPPGPYGLQGLAPASKPRTIGLVMGLITTFAMLLLVLVVAIITATN